MHGKKYYFWIPSTQKKKVKDFFIREIGVSPNFYRRHEEIFFSLIFNTKEASQLFKDTFG